MCTILMYHFQGAVTPSKRVMYHPCTIEYGKLRKKKERKVSPFLSKKVPVSLVFLFPEVALEETCEGLAVPCLVAGHFMDGVMDGVEIQLLGALGEGGLASGGAVAPDGAECLGTLIFYGFWDDLSR